MKSRSSLKKLGLFAVTALVFGTGSALADESCLLGSGPQARMPQAGAMSPNSNTSFVYTQELHEQMGQIEQALREHRISPYEAGRLMRQQWELAQFQQGFLSGNQAPRSGGCSLSPDLAAKIAPLVGDMAKNGMQTAGTVMRALMRETERLLREETPEKTPL